ncbi:FtsX-like permease family protein [bacterium]|nr:FtsX-like permease family protein [bacterium]MBU1916616.1 FtsX-like permease family protein [bacterium]
MKQVGLFTLVSLIGIAASVMLFLMIDAVINGLTTHLRTTLIGFEAPLFVSIEQDEDQNVLKALQDFKSKHPQITIQTSMVKQFDGLISLVGQAPLGVIMRSVENIYFKEKKDKLAIHWFEGFSEENFLAQNDLIVLGGRVYENLKFMPADDEQVMIIHPFADIGPSGEIEPTERQFRVAGIFSAGRLDFDESYVFISHAGMNTLTNDAMLKKEIFVFPSSRKLIPKIKNMWNQIEANKNFPMVSWYDRNQTLFKAMKLEKMMYFIIFIFVLLISCFNLMALITIFGMTKASDITVLRSLGLSLKKLKSVFMTIGMLLGSFGAITGLSLGYALIMIAKVSGLHLPEAYGFTLLPILINWNTFFLLLVCTPIFTGLIAYLPAKKILERKIIETL